MENTMMNVHICSTRKTDEPLMLNVFKAYKLNQGFVPCEPDEADQTYLVSYSRSNICSWLTVSGTHWHDDSFEAEVDPLGLAKEFILIVRIIEAIHKKIKQIRHYSFGTFRLEKINKVIVG